MGQVTVTNLITMTETVFKNMAYLFYPKGIDAINNKQTYISSNEFKALLNTINFYKNGFLSESLNSYKETMMNISKDFTFTDGTLYDWLDRAYNFQLYKISNNKIYSICTNISFLIPFYSIYVLEVDIDPMTLKWKTFPKWNKSIEESMFKEEISNLSLGIENYLGYFPFPKDLHNKIIEDVSFHDIKKGNFTHYNAFFLDEKNIRI